MVPKTQIKPWLSKKWAQVQPTGYNASEVEDTLTDSENGQLPIENAADAGTQIGRLALLNQLIESDELKAKTTETTKGPIYQAGEMLRSQINPIVYGMVQRLGGVAALQPHTLANFYTELAKIYDDADVTIMQQATATIMTSDAEKTNIKNSFQQVFNEVWKENAQNRFNPGNIAFFASNKKLNKMAQNMSGPLLIPKYTSYENLKQDLITLFKSGPKVAMEHILDSVNTDDQESAKEALSSFYQGYPEGLSTLYTLLIKSGRAEPIDTQIVETIMENRPAQDNKDNKDKSIKASGIWLPKLDASISTLESDKQIKEASGSVGGPSPAYITHGPKDNRFCPKLRNLVNSFVCRYHCLDGLSVDDSTVICGEAIWRQAIMDKFSREYRDKDGNWVGGYINKRFEVNRDTGGHPYQLKPGKRTSPIHEDAWSTEKRLSEMRRDYSEERGYSSTPGDPKNLYNHDPYEELGTTKNPQFAEKKEDNIAKLSNNNKKVISKKDKPVNPWAICHTTVDKEEDPDKFERCVMDVKEEHPIKKDKKSASTWSIEKIATPSPMNPENMDLEAGKECQKCQWSGGSDQKICPHCGGKMISRNKVDFQMKSNQLPSEDGLGPYTASIQYLNGVYKYISSDGKVGYCDTIKEAQQNSNFKDTDSSTVEEVSEEISNLMQEPDDSKINTEVPEEEKKNEQMEEITEPPIATHISGEELDLAFAQELLSKNSDEQKEFEETHQDSKVIGPDPKTQP